MSNTWKEAPLSEYLETHFPTRKIYMAIIFLLVFIGFVIVLMFVLFGAPRARPHGKLVMERKMREPTLQPDPRVDMDAMKAHEIEYMNAISWVDKEKQIIHIPIERAMDLVLKEEFSKKR